MIKEDLFHRIDNLSKKGKQLLSLKTKQLLNNEVPENATGSKRLVSYVKGTHDFDKEQLKAYLKSVLPNYMVPTEIVVVEDFPKLPNGKMDIKELSCIKIKPESKPNSDASSAPSEIENKLVKIWEEVLNFSPIEVNDNFFEIGGDSILSIQIIAKARNQGIEMAPNLLFEHQTISELALFTTSTVAEEATKFELLQGEFEFLPMHHWFFDTHKNAPNHWNQALKITGKGVDDYVLFEKSISNLITKHDALRLSFEKIDAAWRARFLPINEINAFEYFDFTEVQTNEIQQKTLAEIAQIHSDLDLKTGGLFKCLFFDYGQHQDNCCVLLANHLVVDAVSWQIITDDFLETIKVLRDGLAVQPTRQSSTIDEWGEHLKNMVSGSQMESEVLFWNNQMSISKSLPIDFEGDMPILEKDIEQIDFTFDSQITGDLQGQVNKSFNIKIDEILATAFTEALCRWSGENNICLGLERHGRETNKGLIDLSNTVGWFTSFFPLTLKMDRSADMTTKILDAKERLRSVPRGGLGYGVLKYISDEFKDHSSPQIVFNYLGNQSTQKLNDGYVFESFNHGARSALSERLYLFEVNSFLMDGEVHFKWSYPKTFYNAETIKKLIKSFKEIIVEIINLSKEDNKTNYSPSDFPEVDLDQDDLNSLLSSLE